jgi:hypothetical protein
VPRYYERHGDTYLINSFFGTPLIETIALENIRAVFTQAKNLAFHYIDCGDMEHFCGQGFLTLDRPKLNQTKKMTKPTFAKANISDFQSLDREIDALVSGIHDCITVDVQSLLFVMVYNIEFLKLP